MYEIHSTIIGTQKTKFTRIMKRFMTDKVVRFFVIPWQKYGKQTSDVPSAGNQIFRKDCVCCVQHTYSQKRYN